MKHYIRDKHTGEYQYFGYDEGWSEGGISEYWYLVYVDKADATEFDSWEKAEAAISLTENDTSDYFIEGEW
jgi:hypothetical protein